MKKITLLFIAIGFWGNCFSQTLTFSKVFRDSLGNEITANSAVNTNDNGYLIVGKGMSQKGFILKIDSMGNLLWHVLIDNNNPNIYPDVVFNSIIATNDSCYVIVGSVYNASSVNTDALCVKINSNGNILWAKKIEQIGYYLSTLAVQQTMDSGYVMTGWAGGSVAPYYRIFAAKLNATGNLQWSNIFVGGNNANYGSSVKQTPDNGYIVTGYMENGPPGEFNAFLIKLSSSGIISWSKKYNFSSTLCSGNDVAVTNNGFLCYLNFGYYIAIIETDSLGNLLWSKSYNQDIDLMSMYYPTPKLHKSSDNNYFFTNTNCWPNGSGITKIDPSGNVIWSKSFFLASVDVIESTDKGFLLLGNGPMCAVSLLTPNGSEIGIIKTDSSGITSNCVTQNTINQLGDTILSSTAVFTSVSGGSASQVFLNVNPSIVLSDSGCVSFGSEVHENRYNNLFSFSPNPATNELVVSGSEFGDKSELTIYNMLGEKLHEERLTSNVQRLTINISFLCNGIYFIKLKDDKKETVGKFVKH